VAELKCEKCGKRAVRTASQAVLCDWCQGWVYRCNQCGGMTLVSGPPVDSHLDDANWLCTRCVTCNRLAGVAEEDKEAIRGAACSAFLVGVKEARVRLGWSLRDSVDAVHALCGQFETYCPTPELQPKIEQLRRFLNEKFAQQVERQPPWSIR
jgi:hypothetical protein